MKVSNFSVSVQRQRFLVPAMVGALDGSVTLAYAFEINPVFWHFGTLAIKIVLAIIFARGRSLPSMAAYFCVSLVLLLLAGIAQFVDVVDVIQIVGFICHFALSAFLLGNGGMRRYLAVLGGVIAAAALLHIGMCLTGHVVDYFGRYAYFGSNQPNLGGEIEAMGTIAIGFGMRRRAALICVGICLLDMLFLQSRSAMITAVVVIFSLMAFDVNRQLAGQRGLLILAAIVAAVIGALSFGLFSTAGGKIADVFLLNDQYRGVGTGFSGRADLWAYAILLFEQSPIIGKGFGYFTQVGYIGPHNILLYALAQNGLLGLIPLALVAYGMYQRARWSAFDLCLVVGALPLFAFNDRLFNINPYPLALYLFALMPRDEGISRWQKRITQQTLIWRNSLRQPSVGG